MVLFCARRLPRPRLTRIKWPGDCGARVKAQDADTTVILVPVQRRIYDRYFREAINPRW